MSSGTRFDDRGQMAGIEVLPFGFLMFVIGALLLGNAWAVVDAKLAVASAAREATRTAAEAADADDAGTSALDAARSSLGDRATDSDVAVQLTTDGPWARCRLVTARVEVELPAVSLPFIGGFGSTFSVSAEHTEIVDPYRSGLPGEAECG